MITRMQQMFILEYLADPDRNATAAARRAGYRPIGARAHACRMLQNPEIQQRIQDTLTKHLERLDVDAEFVIRGILKTIEVVRD